MTERTDIVGVILAGGPARRMGGGDKPMLTLAGRPMLGHVMERFRPQCGTLVVSANGDAGRFADFGLAVVADTVPDHPGPLAGILAALEWMARERPHARWVASVAGDCPFIPRDLVERFLAAASETGAAVVTASSGGRSHHVAGLWSVALGRDLRHALTIEGERKVGRWAARHHPAEAIWTVETVDPFFNVNTPDDLATAERLAALA